MTAAHGRSEPSPITFNLAAERALLGGLLTEPELLDAVAPVLSPDDFGHRQHGDLFRLLLGMRKANEPIDLITIAPHVAREPARYGGPSYVAGLPEDCPSTPAVPHYAEQIGDLARRRRLSEAAQRLALEVLDERTDPSVLVAKLVSLPATRRASNNTTPKRVGLEEIVTRRVDWCWRDRIPFGGITIIEGDPGLGKTTFCLDILARASRSDLDVGPGGSLEPVVSLVLSAEDAHDFTIAPRLHAARADPSRVFVLVDADGSSDVHTLPDDIDKLERHIEETGARIVLIDPLVAYLGVDTHKDGDVRRALTPLNELAKRRGVAVVVVRHLTKGGDRSAMYRGGGSIGIAGAARAVHVVGKDPEHEDRLILAPVKTNLGRRPSSLAWKLIPPFDPCGVCAVEHLGLSELTADELVATSGPATRDEGAKLTEAEQWLQGALEGGELPTKEIRKRASEDGQTWRTIERAKARLGISARRTADGWMWVLPCR